MPKATNSLPLNHWFRQMSPAAQKAYIKAHPNSKYAKGAKLQGARSASIAKSPGATKTARKAPAPKAGTSNYDVIQKKAQKAVDHYERTGKVKNPRPGGIQRLRQLAKNGGRPKGR